ncbi:MAG: hypothetical protein H0V46_04380, partial [Sphingomonas sp.]|nr:hypothetical protein [Sphingomonas sp.]
MAAAALLCTAPQALAFQTTPVLDAAPEPVGSPLTPVPLTAVPAQPAPPAGPLLAASTAVDLHYQASGSAPLWFRDAASREAAKMLPAILRRGEIEGLANAAELARSVETAIAIAEGPIPAVPPPGKGAKAGPTPNPFIAPDKLLSAAWVQYIRALHGPVPEMAFGDSALRPRAPLADRILHAAQKAPSLA